MSALKRIRVTHTASYVYDPDAVDRAWSHGPTLPDYITRGDEDGSAESRAMTVYEAYSAGIFELFHPLQDDDTGYVIEEYDPDA